MSPRTLLTFAFTLLLALAGCETSPAPSSESASGAAATQKTKPSTRAPREPNWISLERTTNSAGAPAGPVYVVTLFEDGRVVFEGHAAVKNKGTFTKNIPRNEAAAIFTYVETINLWQRERRYDVERANRGGDSVIVRTASTEVPWDILRLRSHGRMLRIDGFFFAPHDILQLKARIEKAVGLADWIGPPAAIPEK